MGADALRLTTLWLTGVGRRRVCRSLFPTERPFYYPAQLLLNTTIYARRTTITRDQSSHPPVHGYQYPQHRTLLRGCVALVLHYAAISRGCRPVTAFVGGTIKGFITPPKYICLWLVADRRRKAQRYQWLIVRRYHIDIAFPGRRSAIARRIGPPHPRLLTAVRVPLCHPTKSPNF